MLSELQVKNLALIESLSLSFGPGANILTGETGAGKSILAGALGLLRGGKAPPDMVRAGAPELIVEALFHLEDMDSFMGLFDAQGIEPAQDLILRRVVRQGGRSKAYVNGSLATISQLAQWGAELLTISSQHDQQSLLDPARQLDFLDAFGRHGDLLGGMARAHSKREETKARLGELLSRIRDIHEKKDFFEFQLREIKKVSPKAGEDDLLTERKARFKAQERMSSVLEESLSLLYGEDGLMGKAERLRTLMDKLQAIDPAQAPRLEEAGGMAEVAAALARDLKDLARGARAAQEGGLEDADERLSQLSRLKRKYGPTLDAVLGRERELSETLSGLDALGLDRIDLEKSLKALSAEAAGAATRLHEARRKAADALSSQLSRTLMDLGFPKVRLEISLELMPPETLGELCGAKGGDAVTFLFCPNPGEGLKPLARIASGGELSRVMLALRTAQEPSPDQSLVFDEIDSGLSGATAEAVAAKMAELAAHRQVFVITHQPLMAAIPGRHFLAEKNPEGGRTLTSVRELSKDSRLAELARMLDGAKPSPQAMALSKRLLEG
ncbi:MAG: DNA repair protein RecN [Deltaproteobacteria bacterium]|jgi:DNA repair protein RecN (Recombination protein N)|nr:DNA repair protein RecN [Deltaproteobacteria bacterium]